MCKYFIYYKDLKVGEYELVQLSGCPAIGISCHLKIYPEFQGQGYGKGAHEARLEFARCQGFSMLVCTTQSNNAPQDKILQQNQWKRCREFRNPKTDHLVTLWCNHLYDPYKTFGGI